MTKQAVKIKDVKEPAAPKERKIKPIRREPEPQPDSVVMSCINCGQASERILIVEVGDEEAEEVERGYQCPACQHVWTDEDELAPFRQVARG